MAAVDKAPVEDGEGEEHRALMEDGKWGEGLAAEDDIVVAAPVEDGEADGCHVAAAPVEDREADVDPIS